MEPAARPRRLTVVNRGRVLVTALMVGAVLGVLAVSLPALFGQGVTQCVDGTDGGYCRSYTVRNWPSGGAVSVAAVIGAVCAAVLVLPFVAWARLVEVLGPSGARGRVR